MEQYFKSPLQTSMAIIRPKVALFKLYCDIFVFQVVNRLTLTCSFGIYIGIKDDQKVRYEL